VSELFNNYSDTNTKISIITKDLTRINTKIDSITGIFNKNSLPNLGSYISELNSRMKIIEEKFIKN